MAPENKLLRDYLKTAADRRNVCRMYLGELIPYKGIWTERKVGR